MTQKEKQLIEETANSLADAFAEMNKSFKEYNKSMANYTKEMLKKISADLLNKAIDTALRSHKKLEKATFLTRWYWLRRAKKDMTKLIELTETIKTFKIIDNE